jgi:hypothetical protein
LRYLVLEARYAEATLPAIALGDIVPSHWRRLVAAGFDAVDQAQEILLQLSCILFRRLTIHTDCAILARLRPGVVQPFIVEILIQGGECHRRVHPRQFGNSLLFR